MKLKSYQQKVKDSTKRVNIFGFSAASGKTYTLLDIMKDELKKGHTVLFLFNNQSSYHHLVRDIISKELSLENKVSLVDYTISNTNGGSVTFKSSVVNDKPYDTVLIESLHSFDKNPLSSIPEYSKVYCATHSPSSSAHWLSTLLRDFYTDHGYLNLAKTNNSDDEEIELTVFPYAVNQYVHEDYYDMLSKLREEEFKRLTMGYVNPNN